MLEALHACLPLTIPYASCPNDECELRHYNVFEYSSSSLKQPIKKPYYINKADHKNKRYQARCRSCKQTYTLSEPLRLHTGSREDWLKEMEVFVNAIVDGQGASNVMNQQRVPADRYYSQLRASAASFGQYNKFNVAKLMKQKYPHEEMNIYTDSLVTSIKVFRKDKRVKLKKVIVSVAKYKNRSLVLAFHPLFHEYEFDDLKLSDDARLPLEEQRYAYLKHPFHKGIDKLPLLGLDGYLMNDFYAYMAHFLVLRKLLKQVDKVNFHMDGEANLHITASLAFSDRIKNKSCDIIIIKSDKLETEKEKNNAKLGYRRSLRKAIDEYKRAFPEQNKVADWKDVRRYLLDIERNKVNQSIKDTSTVNGTAVMYYIFKYTLKCTNNVVQLGG